jgi:hypothetical protein
VLEPQEAQLGDTAGLQLALALGYSLYSFRENKKVPLAKAAGQWVWKDGLRLHRCG